MSRRDNLPPWLIALCATALLAYLLWVLSSMGL